MAFLKHKLYYAGAKDLFYISCEKGKTFNAIMNPDLKYAGWRKCRKGHTKDWPVRYCEECGGCNVRSCYNHCFCEKSTIRVWK